MHSSFVSMEKPNENMHNTEKIEIREQPTRNNNNNIRENKCSQCCSLFKECCCGGCCGAIFGLCFIYHCFKATRDSTLG